MTRPKVDPDKRQRTAQACDSCKRRKQKCNGLRPCNTCSKRSLSCTYGSSENGSDEPNAPSPKRRITDPASSSNEVDRQSAESPTAQQAHQIPQWVSANGHVHSEKRSQDAERSNIKTAARSLGVFAQKHDSKPNFLAGDPGSNLLSRGTTVSGQDEEAVVYSNNRMLQDPRGRLLYIGDSGTLSFLQLVRMIIDNIAGPSPFTMDPRRHMIVENVINLPRNFRRTHLLPDRQTANVLVDSFFTNTNGLIEVFHRKSFLTTIDACYSDPLTVEPSWLCMLYLTFAIGLVMAAPMPGTREDAIIQKLRAEEVDRAEVFYSDAKNLCDPSAGFEDAGFWSIQALTLMSVYTLAVSKRNAAYAYYGMAVRSAFALGLHREETMCIFGSAEQSVRRNLWRSLYVLDRFLSASLGRPTAIRESDCSGDTLTTGEKPPFPQAPFPTAANMNFANALGLEASVRSCHVIGVILEKVYSKRKISTKLAQEIADHCKGWPKVLDPSLHWRQATSANPSQGIAILHVNLLYCHSIILLTRPFFLFLMNKVHQETRENGQRPQRFGSRMEKFAEACVIASCHSIALVQNAFESGYLPHRNPFVLHFLFASALVVLSNEFSNLFHNPTADTSITNSISLMHYFAEQDPQGSRLLFILTSFRDVVIRQQAATSHLTTSGQQSQPFIPPMSFGVENNDPIGNLFHGTLSAENPAASSTSERLLNRRDSNPSIPPPQPLTTLTGPSPSTADNGNFAQDAIAAAHAQAKSRHNSINSLDTFFDLARVASNSAASNDGNDSLGGDAEIDFESLWQWPNSNSTGLTPGAGSGIGQTPGGSIGLVGVGQPTSGTIDVRGVSDSTVPLYRMSSTEFGGS